MDPYLEGHLWPDVHNSLAYLIKVHLAAQLPDDYLVHLNSYTVEDTSPEEDVGIMYPDVEVFRRAKQVREPDANYADQTTPETIVLPTVKPVDVRIPCVEIRDRKKNKLITAIEILSPVNKRQPGLEPYREKRLRLHYAGVHLLEIDLLRRGQRPLAHPYLPAAHYIVTLTRAGQGRTQVWAMDVKTPLPVVPVPLKKSHRDIALDLGRAMRELYDQGYFSKSIDYSEAPPPPACTEDELAWMK